MTLRCRLLGHTPGVYVRIGKDSPNTAIKRCTRCDEALDAVEIGAPAQDADAIYGTVEIDGEEHLVFTSELSRTYELPDEWVES